jgi:uncharacterized protein (UPF0276 family)
MPSPRFGIGFRTQHAAELERAPAGVDWLEVLSDHYLGIGGARRVLLEKLRARHPLALHGVMLSIAGTEPLDPVYLDRLAELVRWVDPLFVSDHLCWTAFGGHQSHDLLPVALSKSVLDHVASRVDVVQERLGRPLLLENASAYVAFRANEFEEADFLAELAQRTGCGVLLDVNNLVVNAANLGSDPVRALDALPAEVVGYMHLAGHALLPDVRIDTHDADVPPEVFSLFEAAARRFPEAGVILERDDAIPPLVELVTELAEARARHAAASAPAEAASPRAGPTGRVAEGAPIDWPGLQQAFFARVVDQPLGREQTGLDELLDLGRPVAAGRGLRVYSDAYSAGLRRALATNFAALAEVLSASDFDGLAAAYLRAHPPRGFDSVRLGARLPAFVSKHRFVSDYGVPRDALAALAALEQTQLEVQDAPDAEQTVGVEALAALPPEAWDGARVAFAPALRLVRASHDVAPVIEAVEEGERPARPTPGDVAYLVARAGGRVRTERLENHHALLIEALGRGLPFEEAAMRVSESTGLPLAAIAQAAAERLVAAAAAGLLVRFATDSPQP